METRPSIASAESVIGAMCPRSAGKRLFNPLYRVGLALLDREGEEVYRLVDQRTSTPDRIFGLPPREWALLDDDKPVAKLARLPKQKERPTDRFAKLRSFLAGSDQGILRGRSRTGGTGRPGHVDALRRADGYVRWVIPS